MQADIAAGCNLAIGQLKSFGLQQRGHVIAPR
jgi:hypothetical protein